jgi:hypothetical protein
MNPCIWNTQNRQIHSDSLICGCEGLGERGNGKLLPRTGDVSLGHDNVWVLDKDDGYINCEYTKNPTEFCNLKWLTLCYTTFTSIKIHPPLTPKGYGGPKTQRVNIDFYLLSGWILWNLNCYLNKDIKITKMNKKF